MRQNFLVVFLSVTVIAFSSCNSEANRNASPPILSREDRAKLYEIAAEKDSGAAETVNFGNSRRIYLMGRSAVYAFSEDHKLVWKQPIRLLVFRVDELSTGDVVFAETGKGGGGTLWCLSFEGKVLWRKDLHAWVVGIDSGDNILINGGRPRQYFSQLYSRTGELLWEHRGENITLTKDKKGRYVVPKRENP